MNIYNFFKEFSSYFLTSGIIISLSLVILKFISQYHNLVGFYAFTSASFFIVNLMQFHVIDSENKDANLTFLLHTMVGGVIWTIYSLIMYILYLYNFSTFNNLLITTTVIIVTTIIYFYLTYNNIIKF